MGESLTRRLDALERAARPGRGKAWDLSKLTDEELAELERLARAREQAGEEKGDDR